MSTSNSAEAHFFQGASNLNFHGPVTAIANVQKGAFDHLRLLDTVASPNAILNAAGRADPVRCYPGTREEVISKIEAWMATGYRVDRRIFWLSGPAGAGKSAIVQTVAENCIQRRAPMVNFFFFRSDHTRNHSRPVVATLLRQLVRLFPDLKPQVNDIIGEDGLVFDTPIRDQFMELIDGPIRAIRRGSPDAPPIVILIDGLDECDPRPELDSAARNEQSTLLGVLHALVTASDSPFIAVVASRVESHIEMAFNGVGRAKDSIYLNEDYQPEQDIRHYITAELSRIKTIHPLGQYLDDNWPSYSIIDVIVQKSSGQFIYASTIARFIENSPESPEFTMEMVLNVRRVTNSSPFAEIDAIYTFILSRCKHWESVSVILAVNGIIYDNERWAPFSSLGSNPNPPLSVLGYSQHEAASYFAALTSIVKVNVTNIYVFIQFYHASFMDFIYTADRSGKYHIDTTSYVNRLAPLLIPRISDTPTFIVVAMVLKRVDERSDALTYALTHLPPISPVVFNDRVAEAKMTFYSKVRELYRGQDENAYRQILDSLDGWFQSERPPSPTKDQRQESANTTTPNSKRRRWLRRIFS